MHTEVTEWTRNLSNNQYPHEVHKENTKECERTIEIKENEHTLPAYSFSINILDSSNLLHNQSESSNDHNNNTKKKDKYDDTTVNVCIYCGRQLKNQGGMRKHMNSCKMRPHKIIDVKVPALDTTALESSVWGSHNESDFKQIINSAYEEIVHWRKNIFLLPSVASGKQFITETTKMIDLWANKAPVFRDILMIMPSLLLQKPSYKSTSKEHSACLLRRLQSWEIGDFDQLIDQIQSKLTVWRNNQQSPEGFAKYFAQLMLAGKVTAAVKLLDKSQPSGILNMNKETLSELKEKHLAAKPLNPTVMLGGEIPFVDPITFHNINEETILKAAFEQKEQQVLLDLMLMVGDEF